MSVQQQIDLVIYAFVRFIAAQLNLNILQNVLCKTKTA